MTVGLPALDAAAGARRCGYSQCGLPLPTREGRGPKWRYCRDPERTWGPDHKTCREMAAAERAGRQAVGVDAALATAAGETRRREDAEQAAATAAAEARVLRDDLDAVRSAEAALRTHLAETTARADHAETQATQTREQLHTVRAQAAAAERD